MTTWLNEHLGFQGMHDPFPEDITPISALDLIDGKNDTQKIYQKVLRILDLLSRNKKVVIFCHAGLSRSAGLCILVQAYRENRSFQEMMAEVKKIHRQVQISMDFQDSCEEALELLKLLDQQKGSTL